jgi:hypothetical protein
MYTVKQVATFAYLAGVIDSDGTIGIRKSTYAMRVRGDAQQPMYSERLCVKQVEPHAVKLLAATFGGSVYVQSPTTKRGRPLHAWLVTDRKAFATICALLPYLRIKKVQARNAMRLRQLKNESASQRMAIGRGHVGGACRSAEMSKKMDDLYEKSKTLNRVGV